MKKNLGILLILISVLMMLTGCAADNFFDVRSAMSPPDPPSEQASVQSSIQDYLATDFKFSRVRIGEKYSPALKCSVNGSEYMMVFCETEDKVIKSHCIFFERKSGKWAIKDDIVQGNFKVQSAALSDTNGDGVDEIVIAGLDMNSLIAKTYKYQIQKSGIITAQ